MAPAELIASKVRSFYRRRAQPKSFTDRRDIAELLLQFPELKESTGPVTDALRATGAEPELLTAWQQLVAQEIQPPNEDDEF
jgi:hypothetical protein